MENAKKIKQSFNITYKFKYTNLRLISQYHYASQKKAQGGNTRRLSMCSYTQNPLHGKLASSHKSLSTYTLLPLFHKA